MWIWLIIIHVIELAGLGIYLLFRRNSLLEKAVQEQQQYLDAISVIVSNSQEKLTELDQLGAFRTDDEVGVFFSNLREIQEILNQFVNRR